MPGRINVDDMVSIIIPVYNAEPYVEPCINSIIAQTYKNIEVVIVDDGSTDTSIETAERILEKSDLKYSIYRTNGPSLYTPMGIQFPTLTGIFNSSGEWVLPIGADDLLHPNSIEWSMEDKGDKNIVYFFWQPMDIYGNILNVEEFAFRNYDSNEDMYDCIVKGAKRFPWMRGPSLFRKDLFMKHRMYIIGQYCYEWFIQLRYYGLGEITYSDRSIYYARWGHPESTVGQGNRGVADRMRRNDYILEDVWIGKYNYSQMQTMHGPDFSGYYDEVRARFPESGDYPRKPEMLIGGL